jgi:hypothetical protein
MKIEDFGPINYYELLLVDKGGMLVTTSYNFCLAHSTDIVFFILDKERFKEQQHYRHQNRSIRESLFD